jgi:hypothetical protein
MSDIKINGIEDIKDILKGNHSYQNRIQVGYKPEEQPKETREVGEKWFDSDGHEWEQRQGYAVKLGKEWQQELHEEINSFPNCQKETCTCNSLTIKKLDEKMRKLHGMCFDCVTTMEHKLRIQNKWEDYEKSKMKENAIAWLKEAEKDKNLIAEELSKLQFANEFGDVENWETGKTKEDFIKQIEEEFQKFREDFINKLESTDVEKN